jgi:DNA-directed RNA polymerase subunit M/transcription elongation factor TFIIS
MITCKERGYIILAGEQSKENGRTWKCGKCGVDEHDRNPCLLDLLHKDKR